MNLMFNNYKIKNNELYLYVDDKCEIGDIFNNSKNEKIIDKVKKYISDHNINFSGTKVILLLSGLMLGTVYLNSYQPNNYEVYNGNRYVYGILSDENETSVQNKIDEVINEAYNNSFIIEKDNTLNSQVNIEDKDSAYALDSENKISNEDRKITIYRVGKEAITLSIKDYLQGVLAAEMPASFDEEALKAQGVLARTYTYKLLLNNKTITDDISVQVYKSDDELKNIWNDKYDYYSSKISKAINDTTDEVVTYNGDLIEALYHSTSNGLTEDPVNVWGNSYPYLKSVASHGDLVSPSYLGSVDVSFEDISKALDIDFNKESKIDVISKDESKRITKIKFDNKEMTGINVRHMLGLRSCDFDYIINDNSVTFITRGYGHGVGMSQYGANYMAKEGYSYKDIINHYFLNININKVS